MRKFLRIRKRFWITLLVVYLSVVSCGRLGDRLILFPSTQPINANGAVPQLIDWQGKTIEVWTARSAALINGVEPEGYVLEFTGNATRAEHIAWWIAQRWREKPVEVWVMNYPGYGRSTGPARLASIAPAALTVYDELKKRAGDKPIFIGGQSLGTTAALYLASLRPCAGMILQNPPPLQKLVLGRYGWWNLWLMAAPVAWSIPSELNSLDNAPKVHAPAIILLSDRDKIVPPEYAQCVVDAYAGSKTIFTLENAGHNALVPGDVENKIRVEIERIWASVSPASRR